jgi:hypothetical protein
MNYPKRGSGDEYPEEGRGILEPECHGDPSHDGCSAAVTELNTQQWNVFVDRSNPSTREHCRTVHACEKALRECEKRPVRGNFHGCTRYSQRQVRPNLINRYALLVVKEEGAFRPVEHNDRAIGEDVHRLGAAILAGPLSATPDTEPKGALSGHSDHGRLARVQKEERAVRCKSRIGQALELYPRRTVQISHSIERFEAGVDVPILERNRHHFLGGNGGKRKGRSQYENESIAQRRAS